MLGVKLDVRPFLDKVCEELARIDPAEVKTLADAIFHCYEHGKTVYLCGNGGSGSNCSHFCEDLGKGTLRREDFDNDKKKRLRVNSLTDNTPYILAWGNDEGFDRVFVEQLKNLAQPGDLLIAISGSGNSPNVLKAVEWANQHGMTTSVQVALRDITPIPDAYLLALVDQPHISPELIRQLLTALAQTAKGMVIPTYHGKRGHPIILARRYRQETRLSRCT